MHDFIAENQPLFEQSCQLLFEMYEKKSTSIKAEEDYVELSERVFELRDGIDLYKNQMIELIRKHLKGKMGYEPLQGELDRIKLRVCKDFELSILPYCSIQ